MPYTIHSMILNRKKWYLPVLLWLVIILLAQCKPSEELKAGKDIYQVYCVNCHGVDGRLASNGAIDLSRSRLPMEGRIEIIKNGRVTMMGFEDVLSQEQIDSVAHYTIELQE